MKIKRGDEVIVISGANKGKKGRVMNVLPKKDKVVIEKVNIKTRHIKKTPERSGERIKFEAPIHVSNVMLVCPHSSKPTRVGYERPKDGKKYRISKKSGKSIDSAFKKSSK